MTVVWASEKARPAKQRMARLRRGCGRSSACGTARTLARKRTVRSGSRNTVCGAERTTGSRTDAGGSQVDTDSHTSSAFRSRVASAVALRGAWSRQHLRRTWRALSGVARTAGSSAHHSRSSLAEMAGSYATPSSFPAPAGVTAPVLEVSVVESGRATVLRVSGEIDMATAGVLRRALAEQRGAVVLDLRDV